MEIELVIYKGAEIAERYGGEQDTEEGNIRITRLRRVSGGNFGRRYGVWLGHPPQFWSTQDLSSLCIPYREWKRRKMKTFFCC